MKLIRVLLVLVMFALIFTPAQNAGAQAFTYSSAYQVYNLEGSEATITIIFYKQNGDIEKTIENEKIPANGSRTYFVVNQLSQSFNGSVVIGSNTAIASIANVVGNNYFANGSYVAQSSGAQTITIPLLMKDNSGYSTWFNVQNTGGGDATVEVTYTDGTTAPDAVIKQGASKTYNQKTETHTKAAFAGTVTANQDIVVTVIEESTKMIFAFNGFKPASASTTPVMPLVQANNSGYATGLAIKNDGDQSTEVTVAYTPSTAGAACTEVQTIAKGDMKVFALNAFTTGAGTSSNCVKNAKFVGSAKVSVNSTNQPLSVIANQYKPPINGGAYGAFNPAQATSTVVFPLIMDRNSGWFTGFNIMNVGTQATSVTCTFTGTTYKVETTGTLAPGKALNDIQNGKIKDKYVGSATCVATGGDAKIVGVVNELQDGGTSDQLLVYEGINVGTP